MFEDSFYCNSSRHSAKEDLLDLSYANGALVDVTEKENKKQRELDESRFFIRKLSHMCNEATWCARHGQELSEYLKDMAIDNPRILQCYNSAREIYQSGREVTAFK